jgi:anaerobic dimethyl sulfoxide reductase subunit C (anchor subunit)
METQWPLVLFSLLAGGGGATLAFAGLGEFVGSAKKVRFLAGIVAVVLMVVGGVAAVFHLGHPSNVMSAVGNIFSFSGVSTELLLLALSVVAGVVYIVVVNRDLGASKAVGVIGIVLAIAFAVSTGRSYMLEAQLAWNSVTLLLSYATSALALGGFIYLTLAAIAKDEAASVKKLSIITLVMVVLQLISFIAYGAFVGFDKVDALAFWVCAVVVGSVLPVIAGWLLSFKENTSTMAYLGLIFVFVGGIAIRVLMWAVGSGFLNFFTTASQNRGKFIF